MVTLHPLVATGQPSAFVQRRFCQLGNFLKSFEIEAKKLAKLVKVSPKTGKTHDKTVKILILATMIKDGSSQILMVPQERRDEERQWLCPLVVPGPGWRGGGERTG